MAVEIINEPGIFYDAKATYDWDDFVAAAQRALIEGLTAEPDNQCLLASILRTMLGVEYVEVGLTCGTTKRAAGQPALSIEPATGHDRVVALVLDFLELCQDVEEETHVADASPPVERVVALLAQHGIERKEIS